MFVDLKKAYDLVQRDLLWRVLVNECKDPRSFVKVLQAISRESCSLVDGVDSEATRIFANMGVK